MDFSQGFLHIIYYYADEKQTQATKIALKELPMTEHIENEELQFWKEIVATTLQPIPEKLTRATELKKASIIIYLTQ